ncbi:preprotein translocase subunit SecY [Tichowtungia aerotolerans]|uniref:Protein translocase subunit SecY n=1 Tax=Tichowtungia aerotolerans TaxID=2697043 RepID=A0A6P1M325_9BACT|nr:preprotein translocase subunit SecY [Tichowtungia aerotolerans]QHI68237.1 preprotein translocase subunit SecY [Tichowtungia aerotolerans]
MLSAFVNSFKIEELRQRILFTFGIIFLCRVLAKIPIAGVDYGMITRTIEEAASGANGVGFFDMFNLFSGGAVQNCAVGALGIMPYISASIIIQLMTAVVPALEKLAREGESGRAKITQYTRYLTVVLCAFQSFVLAKALMTNGLGFFDPAIVQIPGIGFLLLTTMTMVTGTLLMMWLGEQITERGIGNGISMIITVNIISRLPAAVGAMISMFKPVDGAVRYSPFMAVTMGIMILVVIAGVVAVTQSQQRVPVQYAKRVVGHKVYGGQHTYMPLRVNYAGVMPIIFAQAILMFPSKIFSMLPWEGAKQIGAALSYGTWQYMTLFGVMILFFSYFWVATQFNPVQIGDDLKKHGGYIPGIRPGKPTAEFLDRTMTRITLAGAIFLTVIAVLPSVISKRFGIPFTVAQFFGGTSLLIMVGVMLDTMRQIESHLLMRHYDGFLKKGKLKSGRR